MAILNRNFGIRKPKTCCLVQHAEIIRLIDITTDFCLLQLIKEPNRLLWTCKLISLAGYVFFVQVSGVNLEKHIIEYGWLNGVGSSSVQSFHFDIIKIQSRFKDQWYFVMLRFRLLP